MKYLIWSMDHQAWWKPKGMGYSKKKVEAGRFTIEETSRYRLDGAWDDDPSGADVLVVEHEGGADPEWNVVATRIF